MYMYIMNTELTSNIHLNNTEKKRLLHATTTFQFSIIIHERELNVSVRGRLQKSGIDTQVDDINRSEAQANANKSNCDCNAERYCFDQLVLVCVEERREKHHQKPLEL